MLSPSTTRVSGAIGRLGRAPLQPEAALLDQARHGVEAPRVPGHDDGEERRHLDVVELVQDQLLLALAGARREQHRPALAVEPPQRLRELELLGRRRHVELQAAGHDHVLRAERGKPLRVLRALRRDGRESGETAARESREPPVAGPRFFGQPRVDEIERDAAPAAGVDQVGPDLGLHQDPGVRPVVIQESPPPPREDRRAGSSARRARRRAPAPPPARSASCA